MFGVVQCFESLGWENALMFNNNNLDNVNMKEIVEWMATLRGDEGKNPPKTARLIGTFNDAQWKDIIRVLFAKPPEAMGTKLLRSDLKVLPKLLSLISGFNVIPRLGDKLFIRNFEIRVLHALMTGQPKLSFRHLVLLNVWESRVSRMRCMLPHCRLLSSLMVKQKVVTATSPFEKLTQRYFRFDRLTAFGWIYMERPTEHVLIDDKTKRQMVVPKEGVHQTEEEEPERREPEGAGGSYQHHQHAHDSSAFSESILHGRPSGFTRWPKDARASWDRMTWW
ncbi:hypothetical protein R6Q59_033643 [Mikania micrantha]